MADILLDWQSVPATPAAGQMIWWIDNPGAIPCMKDSGGLIWARSENAAIAAQGPGFAAVTYVTNSDIIIPSFSMQAKSTFLWTISASKTGAGIATPIYRVLIGSARTTADTARLTLTGPAQTGVIDIGTLFIMVTCRSVGASGIIQGTAWWAHRGTAASSTIGTGFANDGTGHVEGTSAGFDNTALSGLFIGISIDGGASASWTLTQCIASAKW